MRKVKKNVVGGIIAVLLAVYLMHYLGNLLRPISLDDAFHTINTFHDMPENSIEVIVYGSSRAWAGVNVMEMYEKYGIGAYNYGCKWQAMNTTKLFIHDSFRTQTPKVVLIECHRVNTLLEDMDPDGEIYYTHAVPEMPEKWAYLRQCFGSHIGRYLSYYLPLVGNHGNWINVNAESFLKNSDWQDFYKTMGYEDKGKETTPLIINDPETFNQRDPSDEALENLNNIVKMCKERGAEIIFFNTPWQGEYKYGDFFTKYAAENGCAYFNLFEKMDEIGIDPDTDFSDTAHLNRSGATKVADYLGAYIAENYDVTDMRLVENNIWEQGLNRE